LQHPEIVYTVPASQIQQYQAHHHLLISPALLSLGTHLQMTTNGTR
jgi:hypothetical protein